MAPYCLGFRCPLFLPGVGASPLDSVSLRQENETRTSVHYFMKRIQDIKVYNMVKKRRAESEFLNFEGAQELIVSLFYPELEFLKRLWALGTGEEEGYRTGPPGYIG
jgi:hypothetical protein